MNIANICFKTESTWVLNRVCAISPCANLPFCIVLVRLGVKQIHIIASCLQITQVMPFRLKPLVAALALLAALASASARRHPNRGGTVSYGVRIYG